MTIRLTTFAFILAFAGAFLLPRPAEACGGFFCDAASPVNQAAERIIFAHNEDGSTTAVIQIQYSGPAEEFAWLLPVHGSPEVGVSSNIALNALQGQTNPRYQMTVEVEGECETPSPSSFGGADGGAVFFDAAAGADGGTGGVSVVDSGSVGPYDYVVIDIELPSDDVAEQATAWLRDNGYDVSELGRDRLVPYLEAGMNLLAFRLTKGRAAGDIRPVTLGFGTGLPSIPLRPTAAAAVDDMGIMVFVIGESRAIPANYLHLELNEARINWFNPISNYNDVVTLAANEAGGQGFVTEFAGDSSPLSDAIWPAWQQSQWESLQSTPVTDRQTIVQTLGLLSGFDGLAEVVRGTVPKPEGVTETEWRDLPLDNLWRLDDTVEGFDRDVFFAAIEEEVIAPVRDTATLFRAGSKTTRMYTTMSPEEMTMDPVFDFHATLPDYDSLHNVTRVIECNPSVSQLEAPWRVTFADGITVRGEGTDWPLSTSEDLPATRTAQRIGTEGEGVVVIDNSDRIEEVVAAYNAPLLDSARRSVAAADSGTCSATGAVPFGTLAILGFALLGLSVRRRTR